MDLNYLLKHQLCINTVHWLEMSELLLKLSKAIRKKDKQTIAKGIVKIFYYVTAVANNYNIDMNHAWKIWTVKAMSKHYHSLT